MSLKNLAWTVVLLAGIACGCSEDPSKHHHEHSADGKEPCCAFHAKKEAPAPERVELGKGAAGGVQVTATQVGGLTPGDVALVQIKTDKPLPEGSKIRAWIGHRADQGQDQRGVLRPPRGVGRRGVRPREDLARHEVVDRGRAQGGAERDDVVRPQALNGPAGATADVGPACDACGAGAHPGSEYAACARRLRTRLKPHKTAWPWVTRGNLFDARHSMTSGPSGPGVCGRRF